MGQYREWLHYREIDQQLQRQRAQMEQDLINLQEQAHRLQRHNYYAHNSIAQALQRSMSNTVPTEAHSEFIPTSISNPTIPSPQSKSASLTIPSRYTNANEQLHSSSLKASALSPLDALPARELSEQPEDTHTLADYPEQSHRTVERVISPGSRTFPIDQASKRVDQLVLRWFERWGKLPRGEQGTGEDEPYV